MLASIPFFILPTSLRIRPLLDAKIDLRLNRFFSHAKQACPGCPALRKLQIYFIFLFLPTPKTILPLDPTMKIFSSFWLFWKNTEKMSTNERHLNNKWMTEIYQKVIYIFIQFFFANPNVCLNLLMYLNVCIWMVPLDIKIFHLN